MVLPIEIDFAPALVEMLLKFLVQLLDGVESHRGMALFDGGKWNIEGARIAGFCQPFVAFAGGMAGLIGCIKQGLR